MTAILCERKQALSGGFEVEIVKFFREVSRGNIYVLKKEVFTCYF